MKNHVMINKKVVYAGEIYHITQRAPGIEKLFMDENDRLYFLKLLKKMSVAYGIDVVAFALMPNHIHLLLKIQKVNLDRAMKYLFQRYAQGYNSKYNRKGHVFCGVYRASHVDSDSYLLTASIYIHLNPFKAGLSDDPMDSRWTSVAVFVNQVDKAFVKFNVIYDLLENLGVSNPRLVYCRLLKQGRTLEMNISYDKCHQLHTLSRNIAIWLNAEVNLLNVKGSKFTEIIELENKIDSIKHIKRFNAENKEILSYVVEQLSSQNFSNQEIAEILNVSRMTIYRLLQKR